MQRGHSAQLLTQFLSLNTVGKRVPVPFRISASTRNGLTGGSDLVDGGG